MIALEHVHKAFGSFVAVHDADFNIRRGEFFAMLGPSGCGKTTTLRMIAGFEEPTSGRILLDGHDVAGTPPHRRDVNTVFQQYALFPHMNVFDNVAYGPRSRKVAEPELRTKVGEMLDIVRLGDYVKRKPSQLSGGQQQRVALARALVNLPSALLLDEPLGALDLKLRQAMQLELKRIQREVGIAFVFVTHDQDEALTMSDRIAVMSQGRVEQIGSPEEIYGQPASVFVAGFIGSANLLPARIRSATGREVVAETATGAVVVGTVDGRSFQPGAAATVMIRPECIEVSTSEPVVPERLRVRVTATIFQGASSKVIVQTVDDTELIVHRDSGSDTFGVRPGDELWISWRTGSAYVLPETTSVIGATTTDIDEVEAAL